MEDREEEDGDFSWTVLIAALISTVLLTALIIIILAYRKSRVKLPSVGEFIQPAVTTIHSSLMLTAGSVH